MCLAVLVTMFAQAHESMAIGVWNSMLCTSDRKNMCQDPGLSPIPRPIGLLGTESAVLKR